MSSITPTSSTAPVTPSGTTSQTSQSDNTTLDKNQFLQLMMAELKNQNPLSASNSDPMQYVTELAQFTSLEQQTNTAQSTAQDATAQQNTAALATIGHTVTYTDSTGATVSGTVQKVNFTSSGPTVTVDGVGGIAFSSVTEVQ